MERNIQGKRQPASTAENASRFLFILKFKYYMSAEQKPGVTAWYKLSSLDPPMSDVEDGDFEESKELSGTDVDLAEDSGEVSETIERPQRLKLTLKPRASALGTSTPKFKGTGTGTGTGRPRGRPKGSGSGSGSGLTLKVRRKQPDIGMDEPETPHIATPAAETSTLSLVISCL